MSRQCFLTVTILTSEVGISYTVRIIDISAVRLVDLVSVTLLNKLQQRPQNIESDCGMNPSSRILHYLFISSGRTTREPPHAEIGTDELESMAG